VVAYSQIGINARLAAVAATIDAGGANGSLLLLAGANSSQVISTIPLSRPSATAAGGVLTFGGTPIDVAAAGTGFVTGGVIEDSLGNVVVSGLTAGPVGSTADIILSNLSISAGQVIGVNAFQIVGA